jgi:hypothetical protein
MSVGKKRRKKREGGEKRYYKVSMRSEKAGVVVMVGRRGAKRTREAQTTSGRVRASKGRKPVLVQVMNLAASTEWIGRVWFFKRVKLMG